MVKLLKLPPLFYDPPQEPLRISHQDDDILVLSKPGGILSVPGKAEDQRDSLETRAQLKIPNALLTHRLDLETSGIFMMALHKPTQAHINLQFEKRRTQKCYIARVWGHVDGESGRVDLPMCNDWEVLERGKCGGAFATSRRILDYSSPEGGGFDHLHRPSTVLKIFNISNV